MLGKGTERESRRARKLLESTPEDSLGLLMEKYGEAIGREIKVRRNKPVKMARWRTSVQGTEAREPK